ncbi:uncharacterized protein LOC127425619 [Myxocyprinus asiaticus]|uniref:uncharacterized protein LOC127425619 n=1 Tax=Myxocyprinus asiaticus TaxID=70543 RepID=UPI002221D095|nr:uncharacterized protein LOC127425619 [Myxocyprinus asiaticus]
MPAVCCAVGCHNNRRKNKDIRLYSIPKEPKRRLIWLAAIRRAHWTPTKHSVLCNEHFISGEKSENPMSPDFVPSVFAHTSAAQKQRNVYKLKRFEQTQALKRKRTQAVDESHTTVAINNNDTDLEKTDRYDEHSYATTVHSPQTFTTCTNTACQATVKALTDECTALRAEVTRVKEKADRMFFESFKNSDKMVRELTGLPSYTKLMAVFAFLSGFLRDSPGLTPFHGFLITLMRIKLNVPLCLFVNMFHLSKSTVTRVFISTLDVMYCRLSRFIVWPSKEQLQMSLPMCFRTKFSNCTSIIDCFEILIEKPNNMNARAETYSQSQHHNTVKYLISITPQGVVSFVSKGCGGQTSDKDLTDTCGYLDMLSPGDVILANRGFDIRETADLDSAHRKIPAFIKVKELLHPLELEETSPAAVRMHVERVIGQVKKKYKILQNTIPRSLCYSANEGQLTTFDKIVTVCCALRNIGLSVVPTV